MLNGVTEQWALPASIPLPVVMLLAAAAVALWVGSFWLTRRLDAHKAHWRLAMWVLRSALGGGAILLVLLALTHRTDGGPGLVLLTTSWPLWPLALGGAIATDLLRGLYRLERDTVSKRSGRILAGLRVALPLLVVLMLAQPVLPLDRTDSNRRTVAVLVDVSASMEVSDAQMPVADKLRLAEMLAVPAANRPYRLELTYAAMEKLRLDLAAQADWLGQIKDASPESRQQQLEGRREMLNKAYAGAIKSIDAQGEALAAVLNGKVKLSDALRNGLMDVKANLSRPVRDALADGAKVTEAGTSARIGEQYTRLTELTKSAVAALTGLNPKLGGFAAAMDEAYFASLTPEQQKQVDAVAKQTRVAIAKQVLQQPQKEGDKSSSLMDRMGRKYVVRTYQFSSDTSQVDLNQIQDRPLALGVVANAAATAPATRSVAANTAATAPNSTTAPSALIDPKSQQTDLVGAIQKALGDAPARQLAGIVLLTDGRHSAPSAVEPVAERLAQQQVPVSTILMGSSKPPCDAAIISVQAPKAVYAKDRMYVDADLKLDGLAGRVARVSLLDGEKEVAFKDLRVATDSQRTHVELADEPKSVGLHAYQVRVESFEGEVSAVNNVYSLTVGVTDEQTKLLIVEGRPRWEFRYLKNLFADRDKTVKLQYVLLEPDKIEGQAPRPLVHASAAAPAEQSEASALPVDEKEWMKFDVVILGDVGPGTLTNAQQEMLRKFVCDRGGTLIVIGGRFYMPQAYVGSVLESLLPVTFRAGTGASGEVFRFAPTEAGRESVLLRLKVDPDENAKFWLAVPEFNWRNADVLSAKPGTTVLAAALPSQLPEFLKPGATSSEDLQQRREYEQRNALVVTQNAAMGQVMFLNTDRMWRLRYRTGDTYHHKFWGQVLRWATAGKLPAGTDFVKLGTDQARYSPHAQVQARAKLLQRDFTPLPDAEVAAAVYNAANELVLRKKMQYESDTPGSYQASLGELPGGQYRLELESPQAAAILEPDHVDKVSTEFSVDPAAMEELNDLAADRGLPGKLASVTGGVVVDAPQGLAVIEALGSDVQVMVQPRQLALWDHWALLAVFALLATAEWVLRKKVGLP